MSVFRFRRVLQQIFNGLSHKQAIVGSLEVQNQAIGWLRSLA
jgi:hypothetical protein